MHILRARVYRFQWARSLAHSTDTGILPAMAAWFCYVDEEREKKKQKQKKTVKGLSLKGGGKTHANTTNNTLTTSSWDLKT